MQPDLVLGQPEARGDLLPVDVQPLRRDVDVNPAVLGRHRQPGLGAQGRLVLHGGLVVALDPHVRVRRGRVAVQQVDVTQHVAELVQPRRVRRHGLLHVEHALEGLEVERDGPDGRLRGQRRARRHHGDRLAGVAHDVLGQDRLVVEVEPEAVLARDVRGDHDRHHTRGRQCPRDVEPADPCVRHRRAQGRPVEHAVAVQVARVGERCP